MTMHVVLAVRSSAMPVRRKSPRLLPRSWRADLRTRLATRAARSVTGIKGLESARTLGAQYGEAWLRYEIGSNGEPGEAGREQMQQALSLFDGIGAGVYANHVRGTLQKWVPYSAKIR